MPQTALEKKNYDRGMRENGLFQSNKHMDLLKLNSKVNMSKLSKEKRHIAADTRRRHSCITFSGDTAVSIGDGHSSDSLDKFTLSFTGFNGSFPRNNRGSSLIPLAKRTSPSEIFATGLPLLRHHSSLTESSWNSMLQQSSVGYSFNDIQPSLDQIRLREDKNGGRNDATVSSTETFGKRTSGSAHSSVEMPNLSPRRKEYQKVVTFYRKVNGIYPELRMVVNKTHFRTLQSLLDDLSKILKLQREDENSIQDSNGNVVLDIDDLEDGGSYFLAKKKTVVDTKIVAQSQTRDLVCTVGDIAERRKPVLSRTQSKRNLNFEKERKFRQKTIRLINNDDKTTVWSFFLDEAREQTFEQLLKDIDDLIKPREGKIRYLCTKKGRRIRSVPELFYGDEVIVAIANSNDLHERTSSSFLPASEYSRNVVSSFQRERKQRQSISAETDPNIVGSEYSVNANGKVFSFLPPSHWTKEMLREGRNPFLEDYEVDWIHGYSGSYCRNNIFVFSSGELLYNAATAVVLYNPDTGQQRHYVESRALVKSLALHPDDVTVAVGLSLINRADLGQIPHVRVFNKNNLLTLSTMSFDEELLSVECMAFSKEDNGHILATVDSDNHSYRLCIWDWEFQTMFAQSDSYEEQDIAVQFYPTETRSLISCGKGHLYFWTINGRELQKVSGYFFGCEKPDYVNCLAFLRNGDIVTGDSNGTIHFWSKGAKRTKKIRRTAYQGKSIESLLVLPHDLLLTGSGSENVIGIWDTSDDKATLVSELQLSNGYEGIISLAVNVSPDVAKSEIGTVDIFCGTKQNCILKGTFKTQFSPVTQIHADQITGLDAHPSNDTVVTVSSDRHVILWSAQQKSFKWRVQVEYPCSAVKFHPQGQVIAVGTENGRWIVRNAIDAEHIASFQNGNSEITCMAYSSDAKEFAVGCTAGSVNLYSSFDWGRGYRPLSVFQIGLSAIMTIDWSTTNSFLRICTRNLDYSVWSTADQKEFQNDQILRDLTWNSQNCSLSFNTIGIWTGQPETTFYTCCQTSNAQEILCVGTSKGALRLFQYPAFSRLATHKELFLHGSEITGVSFSQSTSYLFTTSREDCVLCQWKLRQNLSNEDVLNNSLGNSSSSREYLLSQGGTKGMNAISEQGELRVGHRKLRRQDTMLTPRAKSTTIANWKQEEYRRPIKIEYVEIHDALLKKGLGIGSREMTNQRTKRYVEETDVYMPVTREMRAKRMQRGTQDKNSIRKSRSAPNVSKLDFM